MTVGAALGLHPFALRDACPCPECRHPTSGQRLFESHEVVRRASIASTERDGTALVVHWLDGHVSVYPAASPEGRGRPDPIRWGAELAARFPTWQHGDVVASDASRHGWLADIAAYGVALLRGVPCTEGAVADVAELFGHVRETNYGRIFDVRVRIDATNLADTALGLSLHTDNPYREPPPTLQLLHCLASTVDGGETLLADGFRAAETLGSRSPQQLELLAHIEVPFTYRDAETELVHHVPIVRLDAGGHPTAVHVNNRSKGVPDEDAPVVGAWYEVYFDLLDLLEGANALVRLRLEPGDVIVFDNLRVLHGRSAFSGAGDRRLRGCYADRDALFSTLAVLERKEHE